MEDRKFLVYADDVNLMSDNIHTEKRRNSMIRQYGIQSINKYRKS
jgi:hypothetical protein